MIYQFRGGLREDLQLPLVLFEPTKYDDFYNMALKQEAAQLMCEACSDSQGWVGGKIHGHLCSSAGKADETEEEEAIRTSVA